MRQRAVIYLLISVVLWSTSGVLVKESSLDALALVGGRSLFAGAVLLLYLRHPRWTWSTAQIGGAIAYVLMQILFVRATQMTSAANAILLQYTSPIWIAIFGYWFLGEKPIAIDYVTMALIGGGMFLFFGDELTPAGMMGNILAILSGIAMAWFMLFLRKQKDESPLETVLLGNGIGVVIGLPFLILAAPSVRDWSIVVVLGIFQLGLPFIFYGKAIKYLGASRNDLTGKP